MLTGLVTLRVVDNSETVRALSELPLRLAEQFAVTSSYPENYLVDLMFARE